MVLNVYSIRMESLPALFISMVFPVFVYAYAANRMHIELVRNKSLLKQKNSMSAGSRDHGIARHKSENRSGLMPPEFLDRSE